MIESVSHRLVYVSSAVELLTEDLLEKILTSSWKNNLNSGITGVLIYNEGNLLQVLEGSKKGLHNLYGKISQDKRHYGCIILQDTPSNTRSFEDWPMGFKSVNNIEFLQLQKYWDMRNRNLPLINKEAGNPVRDILNIFV